MTQIRHLAGWIVSVLADRLLALAARLNTSGQGSSYARYLPRSRLIKASFYFSLPALATKEEIEDWVQFELGGGSLGGDNPLIDQELSLVGKVKLLDTSMHEHLRFVGTPQRFSVRTTLLPTPYVGPTMTDILMHPDHPALEKDDSHGQVGK